MFRLGVVGVLLLIIPVVALADDFLVKPFLTNVTPESVDVCFTSEQQQEATIYYGPNEQLRRYKIVRGKQFEAAYGDYYLYGMFTMYDLVKNYTYCTTLPNLEPDTIHFYQVVLGDTQTEVLPFVTAPAEPMPFSFIVYGDSRSDALYPLGVPNRFHQAVVRGMAQFPADFIVNTGDFVNDGYDIRLWDISLNIVQPITSLIPIYICYGNHEDRSHQHIDGRDVFSAVVSHPDETSGNEFYYSFDYANAHFCIVSTEDSFDAGSPQETWIRADVAVADADPDIKWKFMFYHIPGLTQSFRYPGDDKEQEVREKLVPLAEELGFDIVFAGHEHSYERSYREDSGMYYIVTGNGGALPTFVGFPAYNPWSQVFEANADFRHFGFVRLEIAGDYLYLESIISDGTVIDVLELGEPPVADDDTADDDVADDDAVDDDVVDDDIADDDLLDDDADLDDDQAPAAGESGHNDESEGLGCGC